MCLVLASFVVFLPIVRVAGAQQPHVRAATPSVSRAFVPQQLGVAIVTGASSNHFRSLLALLESLTALDSVPTLEAKIVVFDLGLAAEEIEELSLAFPSAEHRRLDWSSYPSHVSNLRNFAWKPLIIQKAVQEERCGQPTRDADVRVDGGQCEGACGWDEGTCDVVFWLDAGCVISDATLFANFLSAGQGNVPLIGDERGALLTQSNGKVGALTHKSTLIQLGGQGLEDEWQANGGIVGFQRGSRAIVELLQPWADCALDVACISPSGSSRANHRHDQSALSILVHAQGYRLHLLSSVGVEAHRDVDIELVVTHGERSRLDSTEIFSFVFEVRCLAGEQEEECCSKGLAMAFLNDQPPAHFGGRTVERGRGSNDGPQDEASFFCKSNKALQVDLDLTPESAAAATLRLELVLIEELSGRVITSHKAEFRQDDAGGKGESA